MSVARMSSAATVITAEKTTVSAKLGAASAAFVASGIGCLVIGLLTDPGAGTGLTHLGSGVERVPTPHECRKHLQSACGPASGQTHV